MTTADINLKDTCGNAMSCNVCENKSTILWVCDIFRIMSVFFKIKVIEKDLRKNVCPYVPDLLREVFEK